MVENELKIKYPKTLMELKDSRSKILAACWSPNNKRLAVCSEKCIFIFDENCEWRDKFSAISVDEKYGEESYTIQGMAFSPDSTKLAIGQTDNVLYIYHLGEQWGGKKIISKKFIMDSPVTCLMWLLHGHLFHGLKNGKVRFAYVLKNKSATLYSRDSDVVSLAHNYDESIIVSGHLDGALMKYILDKSGHSEDVQGEIVVHSCAPSVLVWAGSFIFAAGGDQKVAVYDSNGTSLQLFDYTGSALNEGGFTSGDCNPTGQTIIMGSFNGMRIYNFNASIMKFEEFIPKEVLNCCTITSVAWKKDGCKLVLGAVCGTLKLFDCYSKKFRPGNGLEIRCIGPKQVNVKDLNSPLYADIRSENGYNILDVQIPSRKTSLVAITAHSLIFVNIEKRLLNEIPWEGSDRQEKFNFDTEDVCLIFNHGKLSVYEYGTKSILGYVRTDYADSDLVSVRINDISLAGDFINKKLAYLTDLNKICVVDLMTNDYLIQTAHWFNIDQLVLDESARMLLFIDNKKQLMLLNIEENKKVTLLKHCTFMQWVPHSNAVVAQGRDILFVWYDIDLIHRMHPIPVQGKVIGVERGDETTEVIAYDGSNKIKIPLDANRIEFENYLHFLDIEDDLDPDLVFKHGDEWEAIGKYAEAVQCYKQVSNMDSNKYVTIEKCCLKAVELSQRFLGYQRTKKIVKQTISKLLGIQRYSAVAQVYLMINFVKEAIDAFIVAEEWINVIKAAQENRRFRKYVDEQLKEYLLQQAKVYQLDKIDVIAASNIYAEQDRIKCLNIAEEKGHKVLHKYISLFASERILEENVNKAIELYAKYGAPAIERNFIIYRCIFSAIVAMRGLCTANAYSQWADLRDVLFDLVENLAKTDKFNERKEFEEMLTISHYYAARSAFMRVQNLGMQAAKISVILVRFIHLIPADKAFFEAGHAAKEIGKNNIAFVFWNEFLIVHEAIMKGFLEREDSSGGIGFDIPRDFPLPEKPHFSVEVCDQVRKWILAVSSDPRVEQFLPLDFRGCYEASLFDTKTSTWYNPCIITGYPVLRNRIEFKGSKMVANEEDWDKFQMSSEETGEYSLRDVCSFILSWCLNAVEKT